jgi:hypothetical protein
VKKSGFKFEMYSLAACDSIEIPQVCINVNKDLTGIAVYICQPGANLDVVCSDCDVISGSNPVFWADVVVPKQDGRYIRNRVIEMCDPVVASWLVRDELAYRRAASAGCTKGVLRS